jgi:hypothetical protein
MLKIVPTTLILLAQIGFTNGNRSSGILSRNHAVANHAIRAPACVGQASRLSPSENFPSSFGDCQPA